jgi:phospholipid transport system transporter-binding protein
VSSSVNQGFELSKATPGVLGVTGVLDFSTAAAAVDAMSASLADRSIVQLDLAGVRHADSAGLSCLVTVMASAAQQGRTLRITHMPSGLQALAQVSEVDQLIG